ncbi:protein kinase 2B, chloroplastic-like [Gossypium australe]|uniref:Protein kinase 2B, chloroplastic-like n=1 Tax=Gossypium australe TaxID=47621 RepID=A0A5B6UY24_9ROSI|nr:protein kinase 2B, chloroplastic-like [Gossypium australe]
MRIKSTKAAGVFNIDAVVMFASQVEALSKVNPVMQCNATGTGMINPKCLPFKSNMEHEQVDFIGDNSRPQNNPTAIIIIWDGESFELLLGSQPLPGFQQPYQKEKKPNLEEMLTKFISINTETNLKKQVHTIIVRSGKVLVELEKKLNIKAIEKNDGVEECKKEHKQVVREYKPPISYPRKLKKDCMNGQYDELSTVELNEECSAILQNKLPTKLKDLGSFTIPYLIGNLNVKKALGDLGASINIMPYKISIKYSRGIIENVLVKVDKFIFSVDFAILDMDVDVKVPMTLGLQFLAIARTVIDVGSGELVLRVGDEEATLQACDVVRVSSERDDTSYFVDVSNHGLNILCKKSFTNTC